MTKQVKIYHNPRCSKSRETLNLLKENGVEPEVVLYLETPADAATLRDLLKMLGMNSARELIKKTRQRPAPSVLAACSSLTSTPSSARRIARTISGNDMTAAARTAPRQLKAKVIPNQSYRRSPINPRRPIETNNK